MRSTKYRTNDIAKKAGLSPATVSRAINHPELVKEATRAQIRKVMADMGYKVDEIFAAAQAGAQARNAAGAAQQALLITCRPGPIPFMKR